MNPQPRQATLVSPFLFRIEWRDGTVTEYAARTLRLACPCAQCIDEVTGRPLLEPANVSSDIILLGSEIVGRYGFSFQWSDGHRTGIFTWPHLRELAAETS